MKLCNFCNSANSNSFESTDSDCYLCQGALSNLESTLLMAADALSFQIDCKTFSISTTIPKDWLTREDYLWDIKSSGAMSIKSYLNRYIIEFLSARSNLSTSSEGDIRLSIDPVSKQISISKSEIFIFGRYKKFKAGLSQSRWKCSDCFGSGCKNCSGSGKNFESVEERIGEPMKKAFASDDYVLHASGREDVDALNTGGRPFVMEIKNPQKRIVNLEELAIVISRTGEVSVSDLKFVSRSTVELVTESHFDKSYSALTEFGRDLSPTDIQVVSSLLGQTIDQFTPERVAHRRANITRYRKIKDIKLSKISGNVGTIDVTAEAGTYIKELISSDNGRTKPSISQVLSTSAKCTLLTVTHIDDSFLSFVIL